MEHAFRRTEHRTITLSMVMRCPSSHLVAGYEPSEVLLEKRLLEKVRAVGIEVESFAGYLLYEPKTISMLA
eukprot:g11938.t1